MPSYQQKILSTMNIYILYFKGTFTGMLQNVQVDLFVVMSLIKNIGCAINEIQMRKDLKNYF